MIIERFPNIHIRLNNVSSLSFPSLRTVFIASPVSSSISFRKFNFNGSFMPIKSGISTASVAEVKILLLMFFKALMIYDTSSLNPNSSDLSNSSRTNVSIPELQLNCFPLFLFYVLHNNRLLLYWSPYF